MSVFLERNHLFLVNPQGGVEDVQAMKQAGFGAIFCNVLDFHPSEWQLVRDRAKNLGVVCGPWARPIDSSFSFDVDKFHNLLDVADQWQSPLIVNVEKELDGSGDDLTLYIAEHIGERDASISMEAWPFDSVDWMPFSDLPMLPQIFPQEVEAAKDPYACRDAWWARGSKCVVFTFGTYWDQDPAAFDRLSPYGLYQADGITEWSAWSPLGVHQPCQAAPEPEPEEPVVEPITDEQARDAIVYSADASIQNYEKYKPKGRVQICRRIAHIENTDDKWNACRDQVVAALDAAGVPK